jgi:tetratricopeptide (TPR) repeat protein
MSQQKYPKAYEAYQQAVYRDGRNPTFWCSIGVLYYQINQYRDALDAYSRAIRLNPNISEVWYDLGTLVSTSRPVISRATLTWHSTSPATTRQPTHSTHTNVRPTLTRLTYTSRLVYSSSRMGKHPLVDQTRATHRYHKTCIHRPTNLLMSMDQLLHSGVPLSRRSLLKGLLRQP